MSIIYNPNPDYPDNNLLDGPSEDSRLLELINFPRKEEQRFSPSEELRKLYDESQNSHNSHYQRNEDVKGDFKERFNFDII